MTEPVISDVDLDAYVDDQLDPARRIAVQAYLAANPDEAARVMADLRNRDGLRLALTALAPTPRPATAQAARRLQRGFAVGRALAGLKRASAVLVFVGAGWLANEIAGPFGVDSVVASTPPPAYVEDAISAHGTSILRASMVSQPAVSVYDPDEIRAATAIVMPRLPTDWSVRDVQVYPSRFGPSVEMIIETAEFGLLSLFAVRPGSFDVLQPTLTATADLSSAYFQIGEVAYALVGSGPASALDRAAGRLANTLY